MTYNINNTAWVVLTERGAKHLNQSSLNYKKETYKAGNIFETELWHMMEIFGAYFHDFACEGPMFKDNEINIEE